MTAEPMPEPTTPAETDVADVTAETEAAAPTGPGAVVGAGTPLVHVQDTSRLRLSATVGAHLPWDFTLLGQAALMLARYPDGVYLSSDIQVAEDDENSSSVTLKLVHPLSERVDLEFKYALYVNQLPRNDYLYARQVGLTGLSVSF